MKRKTLVLLTLLLIIGSAEVLSTGFVSAQNEANVTQKTQENTWTSKAAMPTARNAPAVASVDGKIYVIGGTNVWIGGSVGTNEMYDPETDTWTTKAPMPTHRSYFATAVVDGKIFCIGGLNGNFSKTEATWGEGCTANEVYDPKTDTWETEAPLPNARWRLQASVINNTIYLVGGEPSGKLNQAYNPAENTWTTKASLPYTETPNKVNNNGVSVTIDDKIYWVGSVPSNQIAAFMYDPKNDSWSPRAQPPQSSGNPHLAVATTCVWAPKRIYVFDQRSMTAVYNPAVDSWKSQRRYADFREEFGVVAADDLLYVIGGGNLAYSLRGANQGSLYILASEANEQYTPFDYGTIPPDISVSAPQNSAFTAEETLTFDVNKPVTSMSYNLDGQGNVTFTGNLNLTKIALGAHNVTVYAQDNFGNVGASEIVYFTIEPELDATKLDFDITLPLTSAVAALTVVIGLLLIYFKKKRNGH